MGKPVELPFLNFRGRERLSLAVILFLTCLMSVYIYLFIFFGHEFHPIQVAAALVWVGYYVYLIFGAVVFVITSMGINNFNI